jgi:hypothetical protein
MLPSFVREGSDLSAQGKAFSYAITPSSGVGPPKQKINADVEQWDDCRNCEEFDDCHKFCMTRLFLEIAVSQR